MMRTTQYIRRFSHWTAHTDHALIECRHSQALRKGGLFVVTLICPPLVVDVASLCLANPSSDKKTFPRLDPRYQHYFVETN